MAPNGRRSRKTISKTSKPRTSGYKKKNNKSITKTTSVNDSSSNSSCILSTSDNLSSNIHGGNDDHFQSAVVEDEMMSTTSPCSTPKAQRFRIPEIQTCPPAPKKQRVHSSCSLQRTPIAFFAPPDIELFFLFALRDISI